MGNVFGCGIDLEGDLDLRVRLFRPLFPLNLDQKAVIIRKVTALKSIDRNPDVSHAGFNAAGVLVVQMTSAKEWSKPVVVKINGSVCYFQNFHAFAQDVGQRVQQCELVTA